jgi:hypothetical protein
MINDFFDEGKEKISKVKVKDKSYKRGIAINY